MGQYRRGRGKEDSMPDVYAGGDIVRGAARSSSLWETVAEQLRQCTRSSLVVSRRERLYRVFPQFIVLIIYLTLQRLSEKSLSAFGM